MIRRKMLLSLAALLTVLSLGMSAHSHPAGRPTPTAACFGCCDDPTCPPGCDPSCPPNCCDSSAAPAGR
jgi:hypothetical protein